MLESSPTLAYPCSHEKQSMCHFKHSLFEHDDAIVSQDLYTAEELSSDTYKQGECFYDKANQFLNNYSHRRYFILIFQNLRRNCFDIFQSCLRQANVSKLVKLFLQAQMQSNCALRSPLQRRSYVSRNLQLE